MSITKSRFFSVQSALFIALSMLGTSFAQLDAVVTQVAGPEVDGYAVGQFLTPGGSLAATWNLQTSVSQTDFSNDAIQGGNQGIQYVSLNEVNGSDDTNLITFSVNPVVGGDIGLSIAQSPYFDADETWNGGNFETAQFSIFWSGGGLATVSDPDGQLALTNGGGIASGTNVVFANDRAFNNADSWEISLPLGVEQVALQWSSVNPGENTDLTREWVTFNAVLTVPEPTAGALFSMALLSLGFLRRRRR